MFLEWQLSGLGKDEDKHVRTERVERIQDLIYFQLVEINERQNIMSGFRIIIFNSLLDRETLEKTSS